MKIPLKIKEGWLKKSFNPIEHGIAMVKIKKREKYGKRSKEIEILGLASKKKEWNMIEILDVISSRKNIIFKPDKEKNVKAIRFK